MDCPAFEISVFSKQCYKFFLITSLSLQTLEDHSPDASSSKPCASAKKSVIPIDISDDDSCPGTVVGL